MNIITFNNEKFVLEDLKNCSWNAGRFLYKLISENKFYEVLGNDSKLIVLLDDNNVVGFSTYANKDCIDDDTLFPWIGFVYINKEYRGNRYSEKIIKHIINLAKKDNHKNIFIATDHIGLYEKYGFEYVEDRIDIYNEVSRIYKFKLNKE